ncbi:MAG: hypothetical protein ACKVJK_12995 [Methylophagaceae bacterium]
MAARNDITGDSITSKTTSEKYRDNWDAIFGKKDQKAKQQDMTELNGDGNRERGRYGEDLIKEKK